jgi:hypothetical protein
MSCFELILFLLVSAVWSCICCVFIHWYLHAETQLHSRAINKWCCVTHSASPQNSNYTCYRLYLWLSFQSNLYLYLQCFSQHAHPFIFYFTLFLWVHFSWWSIIIHSYPKRKWSVKNFLMFMHLKILLSEKITFFSEIF